MRRLRGTNTLYYSIVVVVICLFVRCWDEIVNLLALLFGSIAPLVIGACIAYVVSIPTNFFERHILPNSDSKGVAALRRPLSLVFAVILVIFGLAIGSAVLVPALIETIEMVRTHGYDFIANLISYPILQPVRGMVMDFLNGDIMQSLSSLDVEGIVSGVMGGTMANVGTQIFGVVSLIMTGFFGLLFSFMLLTDTTDVAMRMMEVAAEYLGPRRAEHVALVLGVTDASFHNFIVRQFIEASILGIVGGTALFLSGYAYAIGVGFLLGFCAFIPIVGYPVGLFAGAFMVMIDAPWRALVYVLVVAVAQMLEANFVLPHVGDPRTVLTPVWTTVGVTIGGGMAGFAGMLVAIPLAATIRQLVIINMRRRTEARAKLEELRAQEQAAAVETPAPPEEDEVVVDPIELLMERLGDSDEG